MCVAVLCCAVVLQQLGCCMPQHQGSHKEAGQAAQEGQGEGAGGSVEEGVGYGCVCGWWWVSEGWGVGRVGGSLAGDGWGFRG
jgi:hypothetical protein